MSKKQSETILVPMQAEIIVIRNGFILGRTPEGEKVFFPMRGETTANIGDVFSFTPERTSPRTQSVAKWFGRKPELVSRAASIPQLPEAPYVPVPKKSGIAEKYSLPDHNFRHFDREGNIRFWPRPCELAAQVRRNAKTQAA